MEAGLVQNERFWGFGKSCLAEPRGFVTFRLLVNAIRVDKTPAGPSRRRGEFAPHRANLASGIVKGFVPCGRTPADETE